MKNLLAIGFIWLGCAIAWVVLGSTILVRTGATSSELTRDVELLWGPAHQQQPPRALFHEPRKVRDTITTVDAQGRSVPTEVERTIDSTVDIPLESSDIHAGLRLAHRRKGLLWFPTYAVDFRATYEFRNDTPVQRAVEVSFPLASSDVIYDGFMVRNADGTPVETAVRDGHARWTRSFAPGERVSWTVDYRSRGTSQWQLHPSAGTGQVKNFRLVVDTDFAGVDFPAGTISPSHHERTTTGWRGEWSFESLVSGAAIGIDLPQKLNPGPLASRITFFAPVGLLFFVFVVAVLAAARRREIHPLNYFFFGCAFFAFHLLFAYLVDHLAIAPSFAIASAVSVLLVVSYARLFVGWRFALVEMGLSQLIYLVLFSVTFFWDGFTGLAITVGAILTLFVIMQLTGRVHWRTLAEPHAAVP